MSRKALVHVYVLLFLHQESAGGCSDGKECVGAVKLSAVQAAAII